MMEEERNNKALINKMKAATLKEQLEMKSKS